MDTINGKHIWIIGASTGIGNALAHELSAQGATLILSARSEDKLTALNKDLGGKHHVLSFDVSDSAAVDTAITTLENNIPTLDSAICLAAIYTPANFTDLKRDDVTNAINVNLKGTFNIALGLTALYKKQGHGQLALCGSVAGYRGLPNSQPYSATKAAIINLAETLYIDLAPLNIDVKIINPGFVRTPLTDKNDFDMPMIIEPEDAAKALAKGLTQRAFEIHFPKRFTTIMKIFRILPAALYFKLAKNFKKG